jgi:hypothetical protein
MDDPFTILQKRWFVVIRNNTAYTAGLNLLIARMAKKVRRNQKAIAQRTDQIARLKALLDPK